MALHVSVMSKQYHGAWGLEQSFWKNKLKPVNYLPPLWMFLSSGMIPVVSFFLKDMKNRK